MPRTEADPRHPSFAGASPMVIREIRLAAASFVLTSLLIVAVHLLSV